VEAIFFMAFLPKKAADTMNMGSCGCIAIWLSKMQEQKSLTFRWCSFLGAGSYMDITIFAHKRGQHFDYTWKLLHSRLIMQGTRTKIIDAPLMLIVREQLQCGRWHFSHWRRPIHWVCVTATNSICEDQPYKTRNCWCIVDAHFQDGATSLSL